jgi:hypothetical protein
MVKYSNVTQVRFLIEIFFFKVFDNYQKLDYGMNVPRSLVLNDFDGCVSTIIEGSFQETTGRYCMLGFDPGTRNKTTNKLIGKFK